MTKTFIKLLCLIGIIFYLGVFFRDAQAHDWWPLLIWGYMVGTFSREYSQRRWKNISITAMIDGKVVHVDWYWTHRGALKKFNKDRDEILQAYRDAGLPIYDHTTEQK